MISRRKSWKHRPARPLSNLAITLGAVIVLGIGVAAWIVLWRRYGGAGPGVELDAIRAASALTVGAGGAAALLLAARRQAHTERDTSEQRLTELYTRAVDQLGNGRAPVRLGGLHALERLAQNNPDQRQTIVDVICAYLRMPYIPPADQAPGEDASEDTHRRYEERRQELQVRLTAQRILAAHLRPEVKATFWVDIDLNLTEAHLYQLDLSDCHVHTARFDGATFTKTARFDKAKFAGYARFEEAKFAGNAWFGGAEFAGYARFDEAKFTKDAVFDEAKFTKEPEFDGARVASNSLDVALPTGWTTRAAQPVEGEEEGWLYVVRDDGSSEQPTGVDDGSFDPGLSARS
jgi:hypothetical protein